MLRASANLKMLGELGKVRSVLDVGASRGAFYEAFREINSVAKYAAIEKDDLMLSLLHNLGVPVLGSDVEELELPKRAYDLIYCSHTLEHLVSPRQTLMKLGEAITDGGRAFFEVPNFEIVVRSDFVEEFFLDKHAFHFTELTFLSMLGSYGWRPISLFVDDENISVIAAPRERDEVTILGASPLLSKNLMDAYLERKVEAIEKLATIATRLNKLARETSLAIWGAGRIFDALIEAGFQAERACVIDKYLDAVNGNTVYRPYFLKRCKPEVVVICSRTYKDEIREEAKGLVPEAKILVWNEV